MAHQPRSTKPFFRRALVLAASGAGVVTLAASGLVAGAGPAAAADTATINGAQTFQTITGFGASEAFGEAATVMNSPSSVQQQVLNDLYSPNSGAGLTILRNEIGSTPGNTIEPNSPGSPGAPPAYVSLASLSIVTLLASG